MSVAEVNARLNEIVLANANDGRQGVERVLLDVFKRMSDLQQKWLVRIILKDMKLGMGQVSYNRSKGVVSFGVVNRTCDFIRLSGEHI